MTIPVARSHERRMKMNDVFFRILNMSIISGLLVGVVFLLRFILRRVPKWVICILWAIVALRLIVPFSIESPISAVPGSLASGELVQEITGLGTEPTESSSDQILPGTAETSDAPVLLPSDSLTEGSPALLAKKPSMLTWLRDNLWIIWIIGAASMLLYALISFIKLQVSLAASVQISRKSAPAASIPCAAFPRISPLFSHSLLDWHFS